MGFAMRALDIIRIMLARSSDHIVGVEIGSGTRNAGLECGNILTHGCKEAFGIDAHPQHGGRDRGENGPFTGIEIGHARSVFVELLAERHKGRRGIGRAREALDLVDAGAESPQETRVRLLLIRAGFPRPETQIPVYDDYGGLIGELDMGWRDKMIAVDYEGDHHRRTPWEFNKGIRRHDAVTARGWDDIRVTSADTDGGIVARVWTAWHRRV